MTNILDSLNVKKQCQSYGVGLWQCPKFLFVIMGVIIIFAIFITYAISQRYVDEPELVALIVLITAGVLFSVGHIIIASFEKVALASKAKSEFASIISHQLRNPLSTIKLQLNKLMNKPALLDISEVKDFFIQLEEMNQKMLYMVNDLLELNRIEDNTLYLSPSSFSLLDIVNGVAERSRKYLAGANLSIEVQPPLGDLPFVFADKIRTQFVISHILDNAIRYSGNKNQPSQIKISIEALPKFVRCSIQDEGIGISKEEAKKIFGKFYRAESALKYQTEGLGLRLYLAKSIIQASGGKIGFKSEEAKGSTFWFTLPIADKI